MSDIDTNNIRRLDGSLLLVFRALMQHGQATAAARQLGLSQPAVSHALTRLRDILGDALFLRRPNGLVPTRRAIELLPKVEELLRLSQALVGGDAGFEPRRTQRHFRIGAADLASSLLAAPLTRIFAQEAPDARVSLRFLVGEAALEGLDRGEIDIAVGRFYGLPRGYVATALFEEVFVVAARHDHPQIGDGFDLAAYLAADHILLSFRGQLVGAADMALQRIGRTRRVVASMPLLMSVFDTVARGDAIATVPRRLAERHAQAFGLRLFAVPFPIEPFPVIAVRSARRSEEAGETWLTACIAEAIGSDTRPQAADPDETGPALA